MPPQPSGRLPATFRRLLVLVLLLPLVILVCRARSVWQDEALLGINIVMRSYTQLFKPLVNVQVAPIGYLLLSRMSNTPLGHNDIAIRLPSIVAGWAVVAAVVGNGLGYAVVSKKKEDVRPLFRALESRRESYRTTVPLHFRPKSTVQLEYYSAQAHASGRGCLEGYTLSRDKDWEPFLRDALVHREVAAILSHSRERFGGPFTARQVADEVARSLRERDPLDAHGLRLRRVVWATGAALIEVEQSRPPR